MPLATWSLSRDGKDAPPRFPNGRPVNPRMKAIYRVVLRVTKGEERIERDTTTKQPLRYLELLTGVIAKQIDELLAELPQPDDMAFEVYRWR